MKRVLQTKAFARWSKLPRQALCDAAREIERGEYEADLGKGVVKKRVAYPGRGKSGGARVLVVKRMKGFLIFLTGRDKSSPGKDFTANQVEADKELSVAYEALSDRDVERAIQAGILLEICNGKDAIA